MAWLCRRLLAGIKQGCASAHYVQKLPTEVHVFDMDFSEHLQL